MNVTLKQLRAFREVADTQNFTAAAQRLHTTQSALSASVSELERALGLRLIERTTRRFGLTEAGAEFLPAVTRILADLDASMANLATLATLKRGTVSLGCPPAIAAALLAGPISTFRKRHPNVSVILKDSAVGASLNSLKSGELEIAIGTLAHPDPALVVTPFANDRMVALVPREWPLARKRMLAWRALAEHPIVAPARESSTREIIEHTYEKATGRPFKPVIETAYWLTSIALVEAGLGVAVTPSYAVAHLAIDRARVLQLVQPAVSRPIEIITHRERLLSPAARAFVELLVER